MKNQAAATRPQPTTTKDALRFARSAGRAGEAGPYVLVGHSYGFNRRALCDTYPKEVSGLVLIDVLSEGLQDAEHPNNGRYSEN